MKRGILIILAALAMACEDRITKEYYTYEIIIVDTDTDENTDPYCINGEELCTEIYNPTCMERDDGVWVLYIEDNCVCVDGTPHRTFAVQMCTDGCGVRPHGVDVCMEDLEQ